MLSYVPVLRYGPIESTVPSVFLGRSVVSESCSLAFHRRLNILLAYRVVSYRTQYNDTLNGVKQRQCDSALGLYTVSQKRDTILLSISLLTVDRFHNSFTDVLGWKFAIKLLIRISPHLRCVATLPCEKLKKTEKLAII